MGNADAFEAITAVNDGPMPREALPTEASEPTKAPWSDTPTTSMPAQNLKELIGASKAPEPNERAAGSERVVARETTAEVARPSYPVAPSRLWLRLSIGVSVMSLAACAAVILWAQADVRAARADMRAAQRDARAARAELQAARAAHAATPSRQPTASRQAPPAEPATPPPAAPASPSAAIAADKTELTLESEPPGATVTFNGDMLGTTPLVTQIDRDKRGTLKFRAPGMASVSRPIVATEPSQTVRITLKRRR